MSKRVVSLDDKFDLDEPHQLLTGAQAIVRLTLMQHRRDQLEGHKTAGFVTGYRGSPIAGLEGAFERAKGILKLADIRFQSGLNEDLAATALWGAQQAELRGEGKYDGVFGIWYGKGPGVDRSGDVFRHANHAGTSKYGGVLALMGDDHTCESSTSAHQSEFAFVDAMIPVLNPAGVQELLDYGLFGLALSRYAGVWVGVKCVKDNIESTACVDGAIDRVKIRYPDDIALPEGGLSIRLGDQPMAKEARLHDYKRDAIQAFARANNIDKVIFKGGPKPRIGIVTCGKSYLDVRQALDELGIDEAKAAELGLALFKVAMVYPMEPTRLIEFARGLDMVVIVEEKRALLEVQVREELYGMRPQPILVGKKDENGQTLFPAKGALDPSHIAVEIGERLIRFGAGEEIKARVQALRALKGNAPATVDIFPRTPYFCAGCPHNTSTKVPDGSRAYAGIGCHYMAQWMDRSTEGFTQMGGEGANWIGEAPFSKRDHVFQNLGDGTYLHSGSLAVRAAVASGVNLTYKILFNDAVAMTGGQPLDGHTHPADIARQVQAEGVKKIALVTDQPEKYALGDLPAGVTLHHRRDLDLVQREMAATKGVSAIIYDQTCAAEKRRRRKRGLFPDPDRRVFINPAVCEGCGDCGRVSNCVAILPLETELGRKRRIDQSSCNKDYSCVEGFCPSFVTVHGGSIPKVTRTAKGAEGLGLDGLPEPALPSLEGRGRPYALLIDGIGGTGVVTVSAILGEAAHIEGRGFGSIDMTGLAQKGGSVACHVKLARTPDEIHAIRVGAGGADAVIGGDLVVTASAKMLELMRPDETAVVVSSYEMTTGDFTRNPNLAVPGSLLTERIRQRLRGGRLTLLDAHAIAEHVFGEAIAANMMLLGVAYQAGLVPLSGAAIEQAIRLNGAAVAMNIDAFRLGRLWIVDRARVEAMLGEGGHAEAKAAPSLAEIVETRAKHLEAYQNRQLAERYRARIAALAEAERTKTPGRKGLAEAAAQGYHKLIAYKDEYEVARLFVADDFKTALAGELTGGRRLDFHLAPPLLGWLWKDRSSGRPRKIKVPGEIALPLFKVLAGLKGLRGTAFDVFGWTSERRLERELIGAYERRLDDLQARLSPANHATATALAALPQEIRGFGHVKLESVRRAREEEARLLAEFDRPPQRVELKAAE